MPLFDSWPTSFRWLGAKLFRNDGQGLAFDARRSLFTPRADTGACLGELGSISEAVTGN